MGFSVSFRAKLRRFTFASGVGIFMLVAALLWFSAVTLKARVKWIDHTHEVLERLSELHAELAVAETSQRGFFITGEKEFETDFLSATESLPNRIFEITSLVSDNSTQHVRAEELSELIRRRVQMMRQVIELKRSGKVDAGLAIISSDARRQLATELRSQVTVMVSEERRFLTERVEDAGHLESILSQLAILGSLLALAMIFLSRRLMKQDNQRLVASANELEEQRFLLNSIFDSMGEGLIVVDGEGNYSYANKAAEKMLGPVRNLEQATDVSRNFGFFDPRTGMPLQAEDLPSQRALAGKISDNMEMLIRNAKHPKGITIETSGRCLRNRDGKITGAMSVFRDVSARKFIEGERIAAREAAVEASRKKSDFLATMSHEIRTPMNGVIGMSTLLLDSKLGSEQREFVGTIKESAESLLALINGILDHSKIESGKLVLQKFDFNFATMVKEVGGMFKFLAAEKDVEFKLEMDADTDWNFNADGDRIRQVLMNLTGNAIKFTERGTITLRACDVMKLDRSRRLRIEVIDNGPGLTAQEASQIFSKYIQTAIGQAKGGSGLGLMISKQLINLMGGDIGVISEPGQGATFWFEVELEPAVNNYILSKTEQREFPQFNARVLVVEDQPVNVRVVGRFLEKMGMQFDVAENGKIAVELSLAHPYDLILMDCRMPVMNGYDATRAIRKHQLRSGVKCPIIALTAEGSSGERRLCIESGMDEVLGKPIDATRLIKMLSAYVPRSQPAVDVAAIIGMASLKRGEQSLVEALIHEFFISAPRSIEQMTAAAAAGLYTDLSDYAHGLKSVASTMGAHKLASHCEEIEALREMPKDIGARLKSIENEFLAVKIELVAFAKSEAAKAA